MTEQTPDAKTDVKTERFSLGGPLNYCNAERADARRVALAFRENGVVPPSLTAGIRENPRAILSTSAEVR